MARADAVSKPGMRAGPRSGGWGAVVSLTLHAAAAGALVLVKPVSWQQRPALVEFDVLLPPPPSVLPAVLHERPSPDAPPPTQPPRVVSVRRVVSKASPPKLQPRPAPERAAPQEPAPPAFGVTADSVVAGGSPVAVPVGNTVATAERKPVAASPVAAIPGTVQGDAFVPVVDVYIAEENEIVYKPSTEYPNEARRMGIEGQVLLRVGIDRRGKIRSVKVIKKAGYGFDEAAEKALWQFRFTPARTQDGRPVDRQITYKYTFQLPR